MPTICMKGNASIACSSSVSFAVDSDFLPCLELSSHVSKTPHGLHLSSCSLLFASKLLSGSYITWCMELSTPMTGRRWRSWWSCNSECSYLPTFCSWLEASVMIVENPARWSEALLEAVLCLLSGFGFLIFISRMDHSCRRRTSSLKAQLPKYEIEIHYFFLKLLKNLKNAILQKMKITFFKIKFEIDMI